MATCVWTDMCWTNLWKSFMHTSVPFSEEDSTNTQQCWVLLSRNTHQFRTKMRLEIQWDWNDNNWVCIFWHEPRNKSQTQYSGPIQRNSGNMSLACSIQGKKKNQGTCCFWLKCKKISSVCDHMITQEKKKIQWCRNPDRTNKLICAHDKNYIWCWQRKLMQLWATAPKSLRWNKLLLLRKRCVRVYKHKNRHTLCPGFLTGAGQSSIQ